MPCPMRHRSLGPLGQRGGGSQHTTFPHAEPRRLHVHSIAIQICLPRSTRGGARAVASPRSLCGHRNQMARSRHPRRSVRTRRRHSRRSCRCVRAPQPAPGSATHLHTYTLTSKAHTPCRHACHLGACAGARRGCSRRALRGTRRRAIDGTHDGECVCATPCAVPCLTQDAPVRRACAPIAGGRGRWVERRGQLDRPRRRR